ncbi:hypothetical protein SEA_THUNDERCLAP_41 [Arthrobacter phage Thunderclap]|nr:hypothetical protein ANANSI_41 [Arthrobacter phage Anansi]ALY09100.1 hypothetical protein GORGEOUS_41 [Arthrobacter phage Gorgeous]ALY10117.1 hypothetical protein RINGS_40 [Arthrobacter phage Rings]ALY10381.1 hypothetical protein SORJUANA_41 [Arthrobacter phage SorJuana]QFG08335.1 hypothetical protein SEA_YEEZUS_40 [Arthrobacter phage Yeezus]QFG13383.1 hypothetical protein SEA_ICHOR_40 [Arthrobacter phage Ichor]QFG13901.1 hypothetical protein SEA_JAEK_40 [Arthrobacter phage Jaek]QJD51688.
MDNEVIVALISATSAITIAGFGLLGALLAKQSAKASDTHKQVTETKALAEEAKEQVTNAHTSNFREEVTESFNEIRRKFSETHEKIDKQGNSLKAAHGKLNKVDNAVQELTASDKAQWHRLDKIDPPDDFLGGSNAD